MTFKNLLDAFLGSYSPLMLDDGQPLLGLASVDFGYLFSGILLCLVVSFVFKAILAIFRSFD